MRESELYPPVKAFLEGQGYEVKAEVGAADVVACRAPDEDPVIVEVKTGFSLTLFHQGIARQSLSDAVYLAVPLGSGQRSQVRLTSFRGMAGSFQNLTFFFKASLRANPSVNLESGIG